MAHLALHLIAKDEAAKLPNLLRSVAGAVDEVVLCDTGSTDETREVFRAWGEANPETLTTLIEFAWCDDFAAARNAALNAVSDKADWILWADCDDTIRGAEKLRALAEQAPPQAAAFIFPYEYAHDEHGNEICRLERERLVRRTAVSEWQLPIHEVLGIQGQLVRSDDVVWVHDRDPAKQDPERNRKILQADHDRSIAAGEPPNPRTLIYLGTESLALGRPQDALHWLRQYLDVGSWDEEVCQAWHKVSIAYRALYDSEPKDVHLRDAEDAALRAIKARPDWADGYIDLAELAVRREENEQALRFVAKARECGQPQTLLIINPLDYSYQLDVMESVALAKLGRIEESFERTAAALAQTPRRPDLDAQAFGLGEELKKRETVRHVLALRELLVRHDENWKAYRLLSEAVPYYIHDDPQIAQARADQRENILHALDPETYTEFYENNPGEAPFEWTKIPIPEAHKAFRRVGFLREGLAEQERELGRKPVVLDLSGNDGWMAANLSAAGIECHMIEMNPEPVERAKARKADYPNIGAIHCGNCYEAEEFFDAHSFDAIVSFETVEHVPDTARLLDVMERMVRPGGRCYISTPDGAYERGRVEGWSKVELKGHLRAIRNDELAGWLCERGVLEGFEVCPDRTQVAAWTPSPRAGKVVFYAGNLFSEALPEKVLTEGMGGSETALCKLAEQFAQKGYDVRVYAGQSQGGLRGDQVTTEGSDPIAGQVLYSPAAAWDPGEDCDLFVASRVPEAFDRRIKAPRRVLWLHDADYADRLTELRAKRCTDIVVLSQFQRELLCEKYPHIAERVFVSRNGIEPLLFGETTPQAEREPLVVYTSSPDRGLDVLLECWPEVRKRVPEAKLVHAYASVYKTMAAQNPALADFHRRLEGLAAKCEGVESRDSLGQAEIAKLYSRAAVWAYPSRHTMGAQWFPEISCLSGDTLVDMPRDHRAHPDGVPIAELEGQRNFPVWSWDEREAKYVLATAKRCWKSKRNAETVRIAFEEGTEIVCTPDHLVLTFAGEWVEAGSLKPGDRLRGLHYRHEISIKQSNGRWETEHRSTGAWMEGRPLERSEHVHHHDDTRRDNRPESLEVLSASEHHSRTHKGREVSDEFRALKREQSLAWKETPEGREHYRRNASAAGRRLWDWVNSLPPEERAAWLKRRGVKPLRETAANHRVRSIEEGPAVDVYDMEVEGTHNFFAGGVCVHNCISAMEAQAGGAYPVCADFGALRETVRVGDRIPITPDLDDFKQRFIAAIVSALRSPAKREKAALRGRSWALDQGWEGVCDAWIERFLAREREPVAA